MDQVKVYLAVLKKHHFWVLSVIVLLTGITGWFMASTALSNTYSSERKKIENEFSELQKVSGYPDHPNDKWKEGMDGLTKQLATSVLNAWRLSYEEQQQKVLVWPKELGAPFANTMARLSTTEEIPLPMRDRYLNYVEKEFPKLLQIVDARPFFLGDVPKNENQRPGVGGRQPIGRQMPGRAGRPREPVRPNAIEVKEAPDHDYKVLWDGKNQQDIQSELTFEITPTTPQVRFTQENLWVYRSLLTLIANVNDKATGHHNARIKEIRDLLIGNKAADEFKKGISSNHIIKPLRGPGTGQPDQLATVEGAVPPQAAATVPMTPDGKPVVSLDAGRYVDSEGNPLPPGTNVAESEFKRMPVYLRLFMDQREVSHLLVECANSPLPVEVRQLRINPKGGQTNKVLNPANPAGEQDQNPYDLVVELHGIIYIFNPPNLVKLGLTPADAAAAGDSATGTETAAPDDVAPVKEATEVAPADAAAGDAAATDKEADAATPAE